MTAFINYFLEANMALLLFLAVYKLLLQKETEFAFQRTILLAGIFVCLLFPLIQFGNDTVASPLSVGRVIPSYWLPEVVIGADGLAETQASFNFWKYASLIYFTGLFVCALRILLQLVLLWRVISTSKTYRLRGMCVAESTENKATFSFFHFIFIGGAHQLSIYEKQQIIKHESVHAEQGHSFDVLLVNLLQTFFWFNPFIIAYKKVFIQLHEFEADARAVKNSDMNKYCSLLAKVALQSAGFSLANHFNHSLTFKRIEMMRSIKSKMSYWKLAVFTLLIPGMFVLVACQDQLNGRRDSSHDKVLTMPTESATPEGGLEALYDIIKKNLRYPAESRSNHMYGNVLVQFIVNEDGTLSDIELLETPDKRLGDEAIRVLEMSPKWIPARQSGVAVRQRMLLPIQFKLDFPGAEKQNVKQIDNPEGALPKIVVHAYAK